MVDIHFKPLDLQVPLPYVAGWVNDFYMSASPIIIPAQDTRSLRDIEGMSASPIPAQETRSLRDIEGMCAVLMAFIGM